MRKIVMVERESKYKKYIGELMVVLIVTIVI